MLRVATFVVLRYGSTLSKLSVHRFFTLCWTRVSARLRPLAFPALARLALPGLLLRGNPGAAAAAGLLGQLPAPVPRHTVSDSNAEGL